MISIDELVGPVASVPVDAMLARARQIEGRRTERVLESGDIAIFRATVIGHRSDSVKVYAGRGAFVARNYKLQALTTVLEYTPADEHGPAQVVISEADARRPRGRGAWVTVNGKKEV